jgi:rubredoxin
MDKWGCVICGYVYDPAVGDPHRIFHPEPLRGICPMVGLP